MDRETLQKMRDRLGKWLDQGHDHGCPVYDGATCVCGLADVLAELDALATPAAPPRVETETPMPTAAEMWQRTTQPIQPSPEPAQDGARETGELPLHRDGCPYVAAEGEDGPDCICGPAYLAAKWKARWLRQKADIARLQSALAQAEQERDGMVEACADYQEQIAAISIQRDDARMRSRCPDRPHRWGAVMRAYTESCGQCECCAAWDASRDEWIASKREAKAETLREVDEAYRLGVAMAQTGEPIPAGRWEARGYQWMSANLRYQSAKAKLAAITGDTEDTTP